MTSELAQDAAAKTERLAIETARAFLAWLTDFVRDRHADLDEREQRNMQACPHLETSASRHRHLGAEYDGATCVACGLWVPKAVAAEGET